MQVSRFFFIACVCAAIGMDAVEAETSDVNPPVANAPVLEDRYPRHSVDFGAVEGLPDLVFATIPGFRPLRLDLYRPKAQLARGRPLVLYVHGGGWQGGHTRHSGAFANWPGVLASLAARGYVVASIEYRLSAEAPFPAAFDDVKSALEWLRSRSDTFGIDASRAVIWGGSAGGQLAALVAVSCGVDRGVTGSAEDCVQGAVAWYGMFDLAAVLDAEDAAARTADVPSAARRYLNCATGKCDATLIRNASPIAHIDAKDPPVLLIHGRNDRVVAVEQSLRFHEALRARGVNSTLKVVDGVDHSFIGATPEQTRVASHEALAATFAFIDATIGERQ